MPKPRLRVKFAGQGLLALVMLVLLAGCGDTALTPSGSLATVPVAITAAPEDVLWPLYAGLGTVSTLDGGIDPGETIYILAGIEAGLTPASPSSSSRKVVFDLTCETDAGSSLRWWLEPDPSHTAGCGESLTWTLSYTANRVRIRVALSTSEPGMLAYHLTATTHSPY